MYKGFGIISLCITRAGNVRNLEFINQLNDEAVKNGFRLFVYQTCSEYFDSASDEQNEAAVFELIDYNITDVLIIFDESFYDKRFVSEIIKRASDNNVSVISVGAGNNACPSFVFDYKSGYEKIVRHIIEYHNARDAVFIAGEKGNSFSEERIDIYKKVLNDNNISFDENKVYYGDYWSRPINDAVKCIVSAPKIPEAIICVNDSTAIVACEELKKYGYNVPADIIVTGFDRTSEALCNTPQITTGSCNIKKAVADIIDAVNKMLEGKEIPKITTIEFDIDVYSSCGCRQTADINIGALLKQTEDIFENYQKDELKFYSINETISDCENTDKLIELLDKISFYDICVVVNNDVLDDRINPVNSLRTCAFDDTMQVLYKTSNNVARFPEPLNRKDILPDMHYYVSDELKNPVVFTALNAYNSVIGFAAVCFGSIRKNYCKILQYVTALNNLIGSYRNFRYLKYSAEYIENMSDIDIMTQMYNRKGFYKHLSEIISYAQDRNAEILTATIDMDGLKNINDTHGHTDGDFAIKSISDAVRNVPFDKSICGRFGGDEFVLCAVCTDENFEKLLIDSINSSLTNLNSSVNKPYKISASTGAYISKAKNFDFEYSLKQSDEKMYIAKLGHPNRRK